MNDLNLGHKHRVVGASRNLDNAQVDDLVLIQAGPLGDRTGVIVKLKERLPNITLWKDNDGLLWRNNFSFRRLTRPFKITAEIQQFVNKRYKYGNGNFFNSRWHFTKSYDLMTELAKHVRNQQIKSFHSASALPYA